MKKIILIPTLLFVLLSGAFAQTECVTKGEYLASVSEELFDEAVGYSVQKDYVALQELLDSKLVFILKSGISVYVEDTKIFSGKVKIRPKGSTTTVWTNTEAINCN